jgi:hypothetical protein
VADRLHHDVPRYARGPRQPIGALSETSRQVSVPRDDDHPSIDCCQRLAPSEAQEADIAEGANGRPPRQAPSDCAASSTT